MATTTTRFSVPEIHCDHCKSSIESAVAPTEGVSSVAVDIEGKTVTVSHDPSVTDVAAVSAKIEEQGYDIAAFQGLS
ncbi:copper chaperone CopZ [soil metagenome]